MLHWSHLHEWGTDTKNAHMDLHVLARAAITQGGRRKFMQESLTFKLQRESVLRMLYKPYGLGWARMHNGGPLDSKALTAMWASSLTRRGPTTSSINSSKSSYHSTFEWCGHHNNVQRTCRATNLPMIDTSHSGPRLFHTQLWLRCRGTARTPF